MSKAINDGGTAFPLALAEGEFCREGMSLRDWFAGQAISGLVSLGKNLETENASCDTQSDVVADQAYAIADAMMKARTRSGENG